LYRREADADGEDLARILVREDGLRVLYVLPRQWTDDTLPLNARTQAARVGACMVGRAEIIPPATDWELLKQIVRFSESDAAGRQEAVANVRQLGLGRFLNPPSPRCWAFIPAASSAGQRGTVECRNGKAKQPGVACKPVKGAAGIGKCLTW